MGELALSLSGGGFRATFFHFGVIRFLRDSGLLGQIKHISAVSGGSILAAHLVLNWERYTASDEEFQKVSDEIITFCKQDIRGKIIRRCMVKRRTFSLQRYLSQLYDKADLHSLRGSDEQRRPHLYILATSMTTGDYCWFSKNGFSVDQGDKVKHFPGTLLPLSLAVAASTAFPPLFPPVVLRREDVNASASDFPFECEYLSDGGIFDNIGLRHFHQLEERKRLEERKSLNIDRFICSDMLLPQ